MQQFRKAKIIMTRPEQDKYEQQVGNNENIYRGSATQAEQAARTKHTTTPNAHTAALGRCLLDRPKKSVDGAKEQVASATSFQAQLDKSIPKKTSFSRLILTGNLPARGSRSTVFTASSATTPVRRVDTAGTLTSCLTSASGSMSSCNSSKINKLSSVHPWDSSKSINQNNEKTKPVGRNVSFSHLQVREYEVTLGDNPSVSSGIPLSLGWRYNPHESISSLLNDGTPAPEKDAGDRAGRRRRSTGQLRLSNRERQQRLMSHSDAVITMQDVYEAVRSTEQARLERKESTKEFMTEMVVRQQAREARRLIDERKQMRQRRMGIVDGGLSLCETLCEQTRQG